MVRVIRILTSFVREGEELRRMEEEGAREEVEEGDDNEGAGWEASRVEIGTIRSFLALPWKLARISFIVV